MKLWKELTKERYNPLIDGILDDLVASFYMIVGRDQEAMNRFFCNPNNPYPREKPENLNEKLYQIGETISHIPTIPLMLIAELSLKIRKKY